MQHISFKYLVDKVELYLHERAHPDEPWITKQAVATLSSWLKPTDRGLEWGAGRSTAWFARRVAHVTSVESDPVWFERVRQMTACFNNVDLRLLTTEEENVGVCAQIAP